MYGAVGPTLWIQGKRVCRAAVIHCVEIMVFVYDRLHARVCGYALVVVCVCI